MEESFDIGANFENVLMVCVGISVPWKVALIDIALSSTVGIIGFIALERF